MIYVYITVPIPIYYVGLDLGYIFNISFNWTYFKIKPPTKVNYINYQL